MQAEVLTPRLPYIFMVLPIPGGVAERRPAACRKHWRPPAMIAEMNRIEAAARLTMANFGTEPSAEAAPFGKTIAVKLSLGLVSLGVIGLFATGLL
ncbi:hypothetical protein SAZ10_09745 [Mesorhizobium sp. BAC0120]|uniref:hypothetical protein n=1 Tax=Mesorhizobium sp. BAC0120 TaxID=3090670 RepID=UPI00298CCE96|nr:hypothetical protein [Mesorhizobium sp. BAC0120]MDW6022044.1 hypothetical protein [Mesorhizobium sp. BAC0120]